uniref:THAP-type domain-containing protein n=1 Tax=Oryzias melastigma TaxID=30732 RepID=A0A3B3C381_ORYME
LRMSYCAYNCLNRYGQSTSLLPTNDPKRLKLWLINIKRKDWSPSASARLCSNHFEDHHFMIDKYAQRLKNTAVPTIFDFTSDNRTTVSPSPSSVDLVSIKVGDMSESSCLPIQPLLITDHNYTITDSPKTLKRKMRGLQHQLCVARKKLKLKQHTRKCQKVNMTAAVCLQHLRVSDVEPGSLRGDETMRGLQQSSSVWLLLLLLLLRPLLHR